MHDPTPNHELALIVCQSQNGVIGKDGQMPWHYPEDLARFKKITMGHCLIMGRKCFESIGPPLKGRWSIVLTHDPQYQIERGEVVASLDLALEKAFQKDSRPLVCGGEQIYRQLIDKVTRIFMTIIPTEIEGDCYFPTLNMQEWQVVKNEKKEGFSFLELRRIF